MRGYVPARWGQVHYSSVGSGDQTVALFHETPLNMHAFRRLAPLLADRFRVVAFDTPGYGESDGPSEPTTMEEYAETLAEAIEKLGLTRLVPFGLHTGASLALQLAAATVADRTDALVLSGVPYYDEDVRLARRVPPVPPFTDDGAHLNHVFDWEPDAYDAQMRSRLVSGVCDDPDNAYLAFHAVYGYQPAKVLPSLSCPVTVLSNELDPLFRFDNRLVTDVPGARQVVVEAARLPIYWTNPEAVAAQIAAAATAD